jgi:hypothetical protein
MDRPAAGAPAAPAPPSDLPAPSGTAPAAPGVDATQKNDAKGDIPK